jgi:hypothetical protein
MGRPRTGSVWQTKGRYYARVTWIDRAGKRHDRKRLAMDETHARSLVPDLLNEILREEKYCRQQPKRAKKYKRDNLLIYCIQILDGATYPVKIGTSSNIPKRIKMILTHQPHDVRLLASWPGSVRDEKAVHAMFASSHLTREWFKPTSDLLNYIESKAA